MKAAVLKEFGRPLAVEDVADPVPGTGEAVVDVVAAPVLHYSDEVLSGARRYLLDLPAIPGVGAVGRVRSVGPDATKLRPGDWVYCDPTVRSRDDAVTPDIVLQGWSARGEGGLRLQRHFRDGGWAEQAMIPTENAIPLGDIDPADAGRWAMLSLCLVPYGGFLDGGLQPGETVVVSGATGAYGGAAVAVAVAMGAGRVVAPGRNREALADLERRFGNRVRTVVLTGNEDEDRAAMQAAAAGPVDLVLDILPPSASSAAARAAAMTVREFGRVVLMGGVGMLGGDDLALPYPWLMRNSITVRGRWMCPRDAVPKMIALMRSGLLDLAQFQVDEFALAAADEAVQHAAKAGGRFRLTVLRP
ncbi:zinc-binding dehydrogenase [Amycolatopsis benzoatilytica]|uniref:zinc-binding dehydrogenase n=1 Tax=Amycolatopsis benzoatilytica TaxID=346045 RepID=UPI00037B78D7|nr:zinc-binding dehydrogenase [Amycolatopsis benzoatilytica]